MNDSSFFSYVESISNFDLSADQVRAIKSFELFLRPSVAKKIFILSGYAGTGKSSLTSLLNKGVKNKGYHTRLLAPTGRAAKVLASYCIQKAHTIHKEIYFGGNQLEEIKRLTPVKNTCKNTIFFVDEASMLSSYSDSQEDVFTDLLNFVFSAEDCKLVFIGDAGQLPPVGQEFSPALQGKSLQQLFPTMEIIECKLEETHRTDEFSSILKNATLLRSLNDLTPPVFSYLDKNTIRLKGYEVHEELENSYEKVGIENTIVLTLSNKQANQWNSGIRKTLFFRDEIIEQGETLLIIKNNYFWINPTSPMGFLANGELLFVERIIKHENIYNRNFIRMEVSFPTYPDIESKEIIVLSETLNIDTASLGREKMKALFYEIEKDYFHINNKQIRYREVMNNAYFNAVHVKYGYASTVHKAQGGQWDHVFIDGSFIPNSMQAKSYLRWLYTAVTRAKKRLFLVNFPSNFYASVPD